MWKVKVCLLAAIIFPSRSARIRKVQSVIETKRNIHTTMQTNICWNKACQTLICFASEGGSWEFRLFEEQLIKQQTAFTISGTQRIMKRYKTWKSQLWTFLDRLWMVSTLQSPNWTTLPTIHCRAPRHRLVNARCTTSPTSIKSFSFCKSVRLGKVMSWLVGEKTSSGRVNQNDYYSEGVIWGKTYGLMWTNYVYNLFEKFITKVLQYISGKVRRWSHSKVWTMPVEVWGVPNSGRLPKSYHSCKLDVLNYIYHTNKTLAG